MAFAVQMICSERRADRLEVGIEATLRDSGANPIDVEIEDISVSGFRMLSSTELQTGELITVGVPGLGMQPAIVVRRVSGGYGCRFVNFVSESYLEQLRHGMPATVTPFVPKELPRQQSIPAAKSRIPVGIRFAIILVLAIASWALLLGAIALIL